MSKYSWGVDGYGRQHIIDTETNECVACAIPNVAHAKLIIWDLEEQDDATSRL